MTITDVSKQYELTADTLRYYERIGLIPSVHRTPGGIRDYTEEDCRWVKFAKCMRAAGLQVEALIEYVALFGKGEQTSAARKQILVEQREQLVARISDMQQTLSRLDEKIDRYESLVLPKEKVLRGEGENRPAQTPPAGQ